MPQDVKANLFLYTDGSCLVYQHRAVEEIEKQLNKDSENIWDWLVGNKLRIHFEKDKTKTFFLQVSVKPKVQEN